MSSRSSNVWDVARKMIGWKRSRASRIVLDDIFLKFRAVDIPEGIVDAEVQKEDIRPHGFDVFAEGSDAIKRCLPIPGPVNDFDSPRQKGFFQDIDVASGHTVAGGNTAAADQQFHERAPGNWKYDRSIFYQQMRKWKALTLILHSVLRNSDVHFILRKLLRGC